MTGLDKLREIGSHKIFEQTHIAKKFVEDILNGNYSSMNKIQFSGFISILEREYNIDLHELNEAYLSNTEGDPSISNEPFVISAQEAETQNKSKTVYIGGGLIAVALLIALVNFSTSKEEAPAPQETASAIELSPAENELNNTTIEEAKVNLNNLDTGLEVMPSEVKAETEITIEPVHPMKFEVAPRSKLWIGIVDLETFKRTQKLTSESFELAADKEWLLVMGHGYVNFEVNGEVQSFKDENKVWFAFENGTLSKLSRAEFKEKNRGKAW